MRFDGLGAIADDEAVGAAVGCVARVAGIVASAEAAEEFAAVAGGFAESVTGGFAGGFVESREE